MIFIIKVINIFRRLLKSIGKRQIVLSNFITYLTWKKREDIFNLEFDDNNNYLSIKQLKVKKLWPKKICANVVFFYKRNRIKYIYKICSELKKINKNTDITIITNTSDVRIKNLLKSSIKKKCKIKVNLFTPKNLLDPRLLLFSHFEIVKKKIKSKQYTHFLFLEDDILISEKNIKYWVNARRSLKPFGLIPTFLRTEKNFKDKNIYSADSIKKHNYSFLPKVVSKSNNIAFVNLSNFFTGMYFYDKDLMKEHLNGPSRSIDYGHGTYNKNLIYTQMIELGALERASTLLTFKDIPKGFFHRSVIPIDVSEKIIKDYCLVKHLSNKFTNKDTYFGKIKISEMIY